MTDSLIIEFEDNGQDFTHWEVCRNGKILNSFPHQGHIWTKYKVVNPLSLKVGEPPFMQLGLKKFLLKHKIKEVTKNTSWENYCAKKALEPLAQKRFTDFRKGGMNA